HVGIGASRHGGCKLLGLAWLECCTGRRDCYAHGNDNYIYAGTLSGVGNGFRSYLECAGGITSCVKSNCGNGSTGGSPCYSCVSSSSHCRGKLLRLAALK